MESKDNNENNENKNKVFGEKGKRGRPAKAPKTNSEEDEPNLANEGVEDGDNADDVESFNQGLDDSLKETTVNVPDSEGKISTDDIDFSSDKGFNDIPSEEFDLLGERTVERAYSSTGGGTAPNTASNPSPVSEEPIPEPQYANTASANKAGFKNEFTDATFTESGQAATANGQTKSKEQVQVEKDAEKAEKERQKANSNVRDLTTEEKKEAAAKTSQMAVDAYSTYKPLPFIYFGSYDQKKLEKEHEKGLIDLEQEVRKDGTTLADFVQEFNGAVSETFKVKEDTKTQLKEAVYDVLMEKDIALTPMQRLVGVLTLDVVGSIVATFQLVGQRKSDMEDIKKMHAETMAEKRRESEATRKRETPPHYKPNPQPSPPPPKPAATAQPQPQAERTPEPSATKPQPEAIKEVKLTMDDVLNATIPQEIGTGDADIPLSETEEVKDDEREDRFNAED